MTLDEARAEIERRWKPCPELGDNARSATEEPYVIITSRGFKREGDTAEGFATEQEAIDRWFTAVSVYGEGIVGTLYWRILPEMSSSEWGFIVYSRLLISDRPAVQPQRIGKR